MFLGERGALFSADQDAALQLLTKEHSFARVGVHAAFSLASRQERWNATSGPLPLSAIISSPSRAKRSVHRRFEAINSISAVLILFRE